MAESLFRLSSQAKTTLRQYPRSTAALMLLRSPSLLDQPPVSFHFSDDVGQLAYYAWLLWRIARNPKRSGMLAKRPLYEAQPAYAARLRMAFDRSEDLREWAEQLGHSVRIPAGTLAPVDAVWWSGICGECCDGLDAAEHRAAFADLKRERIADVIAAWQLLDDLLYQLGARAESPSTPAETDTSVSTSPAGA